MNKYLEVNQILHKEDGITDEELDRFIDDFLKLCDRYKMKCGGGFTLVTEEDIEKK